MQITIDHVTLCGSSLANMQEGFPALGFMTQYGGAHANGVTHMALAAFPDGSYLELIAPIDGAEPAKATGMMAGWMPLMLGNAGPAAWAIRASGIDAKAQELRARGIAVLGPEPGGRERPDGVQLQWRTAIVGPPPAGSLLPFMIEDVTHRGLRAGAVGSEEEITGVAKVMVGVRDLQQSVESFIKAYGWQRPLYEEHREFGAMLANFPDAPLILAAPLAADSFLSNRLRKFGEIPAAFLFDSKRKLPKETPSLFARRVEWIRGDVGTIPRLGWIEAE